MPADPARHRRPTLRAISTSIRHPSLSAPRKAVAHLFHTLDAALPHHPPPGELSILIVTDAAIARIHGQVLGDPSPTDVITFPGDPLAGLAGEIVASADTALSAAPDPLAFAHELSLYLAHGYLHLAGLDDLSPTDRRRMRAAEKAALAALSAADAFPPFRLR